MRDLTDAEIEELRALYCSRTFCDDSPCEAGRAAVLEILAGTYGKSPAASAVLARAAELRATTRRNGGEP